MADNLEPDTSLHQQSNNELKFADPWRR